MVKLRLRRKGRIHHPVYDIVAIDSRSKRDGDFLERLGYFDPNTQPSTISIDQFRALYWLSVGAQPTDMVHKILSYEGVYLRRQLENKGVAPEDVLTSLDEHKKNAIERFYRRKELRAKRKEAKIQAEEAAKQAEEAAKQAEEAAKAAAAAAAAAPAPAEA